LGNATQRRFQRERHQNLAAPLGRLSRLVVRYCVVPQSVQVRPLRPHQLRSRVFGPNGIWVNSRSIFRHDMTGYRRPAERARERADRDCGGRKQISERHCVWGVTPDLPAANSRRDARAERAKTSLSAAQSSKRCWYYCQGEIH